MGNPMEDRDCRFVRRIRMTEVKDALRRMKMGKALGPDEIPNEVWKCFGEVGGCWLKNFFNKILSANKIPSGWRLLLSTYEQHYDTLERVIENRLRRETTISKNHFGSC